MQQTTQDQLKDGTLTVEHGDAMTLVFGKEKGGYAKGVGSGVTYNNYFDVPRSRQSAAYYERQLQMERAEREKERREREEKEARERAAKDQKISELSQEVAQTQGMISQLLSQLSAKGITFTDNEVEPIVSIKTFLLLTFTYFCLS